MQTTEEQHVYKSTPQAELKLWVFRPANQPDDQLLPAIVFFHGGGFLEGTPEQFFPQCERLANLGMIAVSVEYRIKKKHGTTPWECVKDAKSSIRWLRTNATRLRIDAGRIVAGGSSAGGHLAATTGIISQGDEPHEDGFISSRPNALVLFNPVIDMMDTGWIGGKSAGNGRRKISPVHHVRKGIPPTIIFHGDSDQATLVENSIRFDRIMREHGNRCELHRYAGQSHGFFNAYRNDGKYFEITLTKTIEFLESLGYLEGKKARTNVPNIVVMGIGRCNTSITTQMIATIWKLHTGGKDLDRNYWEHKPTRELNLRCYSDFAKFNPVEARTILRALPQPWIIKDPRFRKTLHLWRPVFAEFEPLLLYITKDAAVVKESFKRAGWGDNYDPQHVVRCDNHFRNWPWAKVKVKAEQIGEAVKLFDVSRMKERTTAATF